VVGHAGYTVEEERKRSRINRPSSSEYSYLLRLPFGISTWASSSSLSERTIA
jgi:hypothetical protein